MILSYGGVYQRGERQSMVTSDGLDKIVPMTTIRLTTSPPDQSRFSFAEAVRARRSRCLVGGYHTSLPHYSDGANPATCCAVIARSLAPPIMISGVIGFDAQLCAPSETGIVARLARFSRFSLKDDLECTTEEDYITTHSSLSPMICCASR